MCFQALKLRVELKLGCKAKKLGSLLVILDLYIHMLQSNQLCSKMI